jgi:dATP/dGTP diphosphohydrolase
MDLRSHIKRQIRWSEATFGPGCRTQGLLDHIRKELCEIEADPTDLKEWIDVIILAVDGAWRCGGTPSEIVAAITAKQAINEKREWPDWRTADPNKAIEHVRPSISSNHRGTENG